MPKVGVIIKDERRPLRAIGITCGIGSMLIGARNAGFNVVGNIEWRKYYHVRDAKGRNTFLENFPGSVMKFSIDELTPPERAKFMKADVAYGHPECGCFSQLNPNKEAVHDAADIPLFVKLVSELQPKYFVMDDLPKSFIAFPMREYARMLPNYDLFPEWVSNYHYGNPQKQRRRMFMIGSLKSERFTFIPGERECDLTVERVIGDLLGEEKKFPNHEPHVQEALCAKALHLDYHGHRATWAELAEYVNEARPGQTIRYFKKDGTTSTRIGTYKGHWDGAAHVMTGGLSALHPIRGNPFSIRERARIQGFPDDFIFYGTVVEPDGRWVHDKNMHMIRQTGKAMPIQFNEYVGRQIHAHITGSEFESSGKRLIPRSSYVDAAKVQYCGAVGYADQEGACAACWMKHECIVRMNGSFGKIPFPEGVSVTKENNVVTEKKVLKTVVKPPQKNVRKNVGRATRSSGSVVQGTMMEEVHVSSSVPDDYHCECQYCRKFIGELVRPDGTYYSRNDRKAYYSKAETASTKDGSGHIAKTPLHIARWAIQTYTNKGDWVFDPTAGAGTTLVEAITHGRNVAGIEIQTGHVIKANAEHVKKLTGSQSEWKLFEGDARKVASYVKMLPMFDLVVNNPPYSGDESQKGMGVGGYAYDRSKANIAFLKEGVEYYDTMTRIYQGCVDHMKVGAHLVIGVKDQTRNKEPDMLHERLADVVASITGMKFVGAAVLNHYPRTLHLNTYFLHHGVHPPYYQSIVVFKKVK